MYLRLDTHQIQSSTVYLNKPLKKEHGKSHSGKIVFSWKKEETCKQNVIRHEKAKYKRFLSEPCLLNEGHECTFHHEFFENFDGKV